MSELGLTQIYWGNGKGKTTAAFGTALRALDNNYKVHAIQFMKNSSSGELSALSIFPNFSYKQFGTGEFITEPSEEDKEKIQEAFEHLEESLTKNYNIIIADEILYAVQFGLLKEEEIINLIENKPLDKELILTGSHKSFPKIFELADLVTEVKKQKHPFDQGISARKGIEY